MLHVDVTPSSSNSSPGAYSTNSSSHRGYEEVDFTELEFPDYHKVKRLGRGSYGTVLQANWKNKRVAAKMVETDIDHKTIHNEVGFFNKSLTKMICIGETTPRTCPSEHNQAVRGVPRRTNGTNLGIDGGRVSSRTYN